MVLLLAAAPGAAEQPWQVLPPASIDEIAAAYPTERKSEPSTDEPPPAADESRTLPDPHELQKLLDSLGGDTFAEREQAAGKLRGLGPAVLPALRQLAESSSDAETRTRASDLIRQMSRSDIEARMAQFLEGKEAGFEGWSTARRILGDAPSVRELYIEVVQEHPQVASALDGDSRERSRAMERAIVKVQHGLMVERVLPTRADLIALLLTANDPQVQMGMGIETVLLQILRMPATRALVGDVQLRDATEALIAGFFRRTSLGSRDEVLWYAMDLELKDALGLALKTLAESPSAETTVIALQTIASFGSESDVASIVPLLEDERPAVDRGLDPELIPQTQVRDAAMATIALLHDVRLTDAGFPESAEHPRFAFIPEDLTPPGADEESRAKIRGKIDEILAK